MPADIAILIEQARAGDRPAILALLARFDPMVRQLARGADLDELRQEAAASLIEALAQLPPPAPDSPDRNLRQRVRARLVQYLRAEARRRGRLVRLESHPLGALAARPAPRPGALSPHLRSALWQLSPAQRSVIHRMYWEEQRLGDVARQMARSPQEVLRLRRHALARLHRALRPPP